MKNDCYCTSIRVAARRLSASYDEAIAVSGVNITQLTMLRRLRRTGPERVSDLAEALELDRSTLSRNAQVLERLGLVKRLSGLDRRETQLQLSASGLSIVELADPLWEKAQAEFEERLGQQRADLLRTLLHSV